MGKIQELSELLANQIAAGEVVERPASVVKELVENAIDAGSTQIDIALEEAGLKKIQVTDNGEGIIAEEVENAFKRHATSKIHTRDDLFRIRTLGFRGEALPSIASVAEVTLETSTGEAPGRYLRLSGGKVIENKPSAVRKGTKMTVENLFFNTPARLKYVKTIQTELANVGDIINRLAMSHPQIAFRLTHDGNKMLSTTGNGDIKQAIAGIYGVATAKKMLAIEKNDLDFTVSGYVSLPELTRASRNYISLIINGRYIRNYNLNRAIIAGYGSKLMVGRFPLAVIQIDMDPLLVDVNVHPTKQEVRLSKEPELTALISQSIQEVLVAQQLIPSAGESVSFSRPVVKEPKLTQPTIPLADTPKTFNNVPEKHQEPVKSDKLAYNQQTGQFFVPSSQPAEPLISEPTLTADVPVIDEALFDHPFGVESEPAIKEPTISEEIAVESLASLTENERENSEGSRFPELDYFGQMHGTYLFAQSEQGLYIVDQHAAQERIKYEYFRKKIGEVGDDLQSLLVPIVLEYPQSDALKIKENMQALLDVGLALENFGQNSFLVNAHPTWYPEGQEETIVREMVDLVLETGRVSVAEFREETAIMMSCKQSIKANHHLDEDQARVLLSDLAKCENPFNCPHGRPVLIHFNNQDMEKMFKRIQDSH